MSEITRRRFLELGGWLAAAAGLSGPAAQVMAAGLENLARRNPGVIWLEGQSCSGCSVSLLNSEQPGPVELLTDYISLVFHQTVGAAQGADVAEVLQKAADAGGHVLVVEGALPLSMPEACRLADRNLEDWVLPLARSASAVVAVGTCAAFGGIPAAEGNETGAASVRAFLERHGIDAEGFLVNCPSCPAHPASMVGTLAHIAERGMPTLDPDLLTPTMYYGSSTHDDCPRFHYYSKQIFAQRFGDDEGCLFALGCLGPLTKTECPRRQWNGGVNWCIRAGAPCIGCSSPHFAERRDFPFYRKGEACHAVAYGDDDRNGGAS